MQILTNDASLNRGKAPPAAKQMPGVLYCDNNNGAVVIYFLKTEDQFVACFNGNTIDSDNTEL